MPRNGILARVGAGPSAREAKNGSYCFSVQHVQYEPAKAHLRELDRPLKGVDIHLTTCPQLFYSDSKNNRGLAKSAGEHPCG